MHSAITFLTSARGAIQLFQTDEIISHLKDMNSLKEAFCIREALRHNILPLSFPLSLSRLSMPKTDYSKPIQAMRRTVLENTAPIVCPAV